MADDKITTMPRKSMKDVRNVLYTKSDKKARNADTVVGGGVGGLAGVGAASAAKGGSKAKAAAGLAGAIIGAVGSRAKTTKRTDEKYGLYHGVQRGKDGSKKRVGILSTKHAGLSGARTRAVSDGIEKQIKAGKK